MPKKKKAKKQKATAKGKAAPQKKAGKKQYAAYYRVSTAGQGRSGAGLAAQRKAVQGYIDGDAEIIKEFKEVESGTKARPELEKAIAFCKEKKACLVASKIDRIARSVWIFEAVKRSGISFEIVGLPKSPLVQQILACVAEWEAKAISERTKAALAIKKSQGKKLGYHRREVRAGVKRYWRRRRKELAARPKPPVIQKPSKRELADRQVLGHLKLMRKNGQTFQAIADSLNESGIKARWGGKWTKPQIFKVAKRNGVA